ncbi:NAD-dependent epimerase/dehydratase family protein [Ottowia thiooxydans]|uniref:NAD-dependent epimerase/dehydratase family protein n=1 Tax=Ottowia thiooxydans TaxID=219182 RepID=UPI0004913182|nr:GDP-mannose 4,6-dehydratase [Ottowia thiooxydans]
MSTRRVLVTGATGFTGRHLVEELTSHGWEVWRLAEHSDRNATAGSDTSRMLVADLNDASALREAVARAQPTAVVHLAAVAFVGHGNATDFYRVNVMGTHSLLHALAELPVPPGCVLLASSANIYGNAASGEIDESTPPDPANDYAVSKLAMEYMAKLWLPRLPIVMTRPFNYTGVGQAKSFLVPKIVDHFRRRVAVMELGNLDVWRDFSDVRAVVRAYRLLLDAAPVGEVFNVGSGTTHSLRAVVEMVEQLTGHHLEVRVNPAFVRANEVRTLCADTSRLRAAIGDWNQVPLKETLRWMLDEGESAPEPRS